MENECSDSIKIKRWMGRKSYFLIALIVVLMTIVFMKEVWAETTSKEKVKVAYFNPENDFDEEDDAISNYDKEILDKIGQYSNLEFEYVRCETWEQALDMLENHEIDLVGAVQKNGSTEKKYTICERKYGVTCGALVALKDRGYVYEDYEAIENAAIGCLKDESKKQELLNLLEKKNISPDIKYFNSQSELKDALNSGEIDMAAYDSNMMYGEWDIIEKYQYQSMYFASWKGNENLIKQLDEAILKMELYEIDFEDKMLEKYFPHLLTEPLTKEEIDFIKTNGPVDLYFDSDTEPLAWYNKETGSMEGILIDMCELISENTGLKFNYHPKKSVMELQENEITFKIVDDYNNENLYSMEKQNVTNAIFYCTFSLYRMVETNYKKGEPYVIAYLSDREPIGKYLKELYPNCTFRQYKTPADVFKAMEKGQVDLVFVSNYVASDYLIVTESTDITEIRTSSAIFGIALETAESLDTRMRSVINKAVASISEDTIQSIVLYHEMGTVPENTIKSIIRKNLGIFVGILASFFALLTIVSILYIREKMANGQKRALEDNNKKLEKANNAKTEFLSKMSHEIRTPLNAILGMAQIAREDMDNKTEVENYLIQITESGDYLLGLINDILDVSRIENGKFQLHKEWCSISSVMLPCIKMMEPMMKKKEITFRHFTLTKQQEQTEWYVDSMRLKQLFLNILNNAYKFTKEGGTIDAILLRLEKKENKAKVTVVIRDTGCGMSEAFLGRIGEPFAQEQNPYSREVVGTGLGLVIAKRIIDAMGGMMHVTSKLGEGSTFEIMFPYEYRISENIVSDEVKTEEPNHQLEEKKVLLVEDNETNAMIACKFLEKVDMVVDIAENGKIAVDMFKNSKEGYYDIILMDVRMPEMNGLEATKMIRAEDREDAKQIPIIAMTADAFATRQDSVVKSGMNGYLNKPIFCEELYKMLRKYV